METLEVEGRNLQLTRVPKAGKRPLRAWDAADEYVISFVGSQLAERGAELSPSVIVVGDAFGTISSVLDDYGPMIINESAAGREAIAVNRRRNGLEPIDVYSILDEVPAPVDVVIVKIPKSTAHLVETLHRLRPALTPDTLIVGAAMSKHIHSSTIETFEQLVGPTTTSLAKKKARLIHATFDREIDVAANPWPMTWKAHGNELVNHGGGFSPRSLDSGTGFLLDSLTDLEALTDGWDGVEPLHLVDLGCGNGVVGLVLERRLAEAGIEAHVTAIDDSALAIAAATASWEKRGSSNVALHHAHRMVEVCEPASVDLVVVNPPFHEDRVIGDEIAWSMFVDAHKALKPGGRLVVVGNRHLAYHAKLKKIFGSTANLGANSKFVVLQSKR